MKREALNIKQLMVSTGLFRSKLFKQLLIWPAFMLAALMCSCDPEESCVSQAPNSFRTGFFRINEAGAREAATFYFNRIRALERDTAFFTSGRYAGVESLPLAFNPSADITTFVFDHEEGRDTLQLTYERNFRMVAPDCDLELRFTNIQLARHTFDSVQLLTNEIVDGARLGLDLEIFTERRCEVSQSSRYTPGFFRQEDNGEIVPEVVNFDAIRDLARDSVFFRRSPGDGITNLDLALNPGANRTVFLFERNENSIDTLAVTYTREFSVETAYCDPEILFTNLAVEFTTFGHVQLLRQELSEEREGYDLAIFSESPCTAPDPIPYRLGFFRLNEQQETVPEQVDFEEVRAIGGGPVFYSGDIEEGISSLELLLNPAADTTTFIFSRPDLTDTLTVAYTRNPEPAGPPEFCDPYYSFINLEIRYHTFERADRLTQELTENREGFDAEIYP